MVAWESGRIVVVCCARRIGVMASITMNSVWLAMFIHRRNVGGSSRSDNNNGSDGEVTMMDLSKVKLPFTSDSIANLDHKIIGCHRAHCQRQFHYPMKSIRHCQYLCGVHWELR
ncbi:hypothetical protein BDA96_09G063800 [Sorghum bicolor]|uniref:Uncharacterized protein n=1 Tax=Sorghum bicolor TaxID=4558 RepID=A0A921Q7R2_SORBI|nr:hypothetical protein BDA96_09G063800 [Sorghum bicolor]KAG0517155.1 hypothetical protein BDA96_09G063800 [Sorghum bicolor]